MSVETPTSQEQKKRKDPIYAALRQAVWVKHMGRVFEGKCMTPWCPSTITVFNFECGHNVPESWGGPTTLENLFPICGTCNKSMGNKYTFDDWCKIHAGPTKSVPIHVTNSSGTQVAPTTEIPSTPSRKSSCWICFTN
jgi:hypothetical protein